MLTLMDTLQLGEISISERGVSEGVLLAALRYGENWVEHPDLKVDPEHIGKAPDPEHLSESDEVHTDHNDRGDTSDQPFAEVGARELQSRGKRFVKWIGPVLKNEDVEAVHQMRVASRRLRATLDGYESACARKPFQSVYQEVKQAADLLGTARDTDVMLLHLEQHLQEVPDDEKPGIEWLISRLKGYRQRQQKEIVAFFEDFRSKRFARSVAACIANGGSNRGKG
jgi:exopolyphosphatase/pppGpp-phosphohydrolase